MKFPELRFSKQTEMQLLKDEDEDGVHDYYEDEDPRAPVQQNKQECNTLNSIKMKMKS